jgi:16S rRNA (cytosine1402-N4)-methyltransferase
MQDNLNNNQPKRRVRYSGTHPKKFKEKYKELAPDQYAEDIAKVIQQGRTPAGMHRSICVDEILTILNIQPGEIGLDATLGYGGHSAAMLHKLAANGKLFALDVDAIELPKTQQRLLELGFSEEVLTVKKINFSNIDLVVYESGLFNFVLADLGVSSMQIDNPERGFTFKIDGPLDLRLNPKSGKSAADYLKTINKIQLEELLFNNADEPYAKEIAQAVDEAKQNNCFVTTTFQFRDIITKAVQPYISKDDDLIKKACQRCFQALRIAVNNEFGVLDKFLDKLPNALASGGRVAILSFHSGEDRRVKKSFQHFYREGIYTDIAAEIIRPSVEECATNPRAKSAKLRWAVKA